MKIKKVIWIFVILVLCLFACNPFAGYGCDTKKVSAVQIVSADQIEPNLDYTVLREIEDPSAFCEQLNHVKGIKKGFINDPVSFKQGTVLIRVEYQNGDYDLIYFNTQIQNRDGKDRRGKYVFDEEQFNALLCDYLPEDDSYLVEIASDSVCIKFPEEEEWDEKSHLLATEFICDELKEYTGETFFSESDNDTTHRGWGWIVNLTAKIAYSSKDFVSIVFEGLIYSPGEHHDVLFSFNYDPKTGERVSFEEKYQINEALYRSVSMQVNQMIAAESGDSTNQETSNFKSLNSFDEFCLGLRSPLSGETAVNWYETENGVCFSLSFTELEGDRRSKTHKEVVVPYSQLEIIESDSVS